MNKNAAGTYEFYGGSLLDKGTKREQAQRVVSGHIGNRHSGLYQDISGAKREQNGNSASGKKWVILLKY